VKRDNDFIRELLFEMEALDEWCLVISLTSSSDEHDIKRHYHARLLCDAGLFEDARGNGVFE
jgi:hypothetical protein